MRFGSWVLLLVLLAVAGFAALNWPVLAAPATLSLGMTQVQAPLGLVMLGMLVLVLALFLTYTLYLQTTVLLASRHQAREMQALRKLADQAEASRLDALRDELLADFRNSAKADQANWQNLVSRIDALERDLGLAVEQSGNALAASLAEMDDRLRRQLPPASP